MSQNQNLNNSVPDDNRPGPSTQIKANILGDGAKLEENGIIQDSKSVGVDITVEEGTDQQGFRHVEQLAQQTLKGIREIKSNIIGPNSSFDGFIQNATAHGLSINASQGNMSTDPLQSMTTFREENSCTIDVAAVRGTGHSIKANRVNVTGVQINH